MYDTNSDRLDYVMRTGSEPLVRMFQDGTEKTVVNTTSYLDTSDTVVTGDKIVMKNIDGQMLVVNKEIVPAMLTGVPTDMETAGTICEVRGGGFGLIYRIDIYDSTYPNGISIAYATKNGYRRRDH